MLDLKPENEKTSTGSLFRKQTNLVPSDLFADEPEIP